MIRNTRLVLILAIVVFSMMVATAVYLFARLYPPEILVPFQSTDPDLARAIWIFGSAPSFLYTLALGLLIGACTPNITRARVHCLTWTGLALCLELSQIPNIAEPISSWLYNFSSQSIRAFIGPYWSRGIFDPLDLLATLIGGFTALILLDHLLKESTDANIS
ncbi:MAG: hypothetical protein OEY09_11075 [Gammaproteobacteria bacterium]|nr:hypothetical protein [Gammaproteobacteria bacterium]